MVMFAQSNKKKLSLPSEDEICVDVIQANMVTALDLMITEKKSATVFRKSVQQKGLL